MTNFSEGDRVQHRVKVTDHYVVHHGTVVKAVAAQGHYHAVCVVDWDDGTRSTVWQEHLQKAAKS